MNANRSTRKGAAAMWTLLVIAIATTMSAATIARFASARRQVDAYQHRTQREWLARGGIEIAMAKILTDPNGYTGETITPLPQCEVKIVVQRDGDDRDVFHVTSEARDPLGTKGNNTLALKRSFRRITGTTQDRIEHFDKPQK